MERSAKTAGISSGVFGAVLGRLAAGGSDGGEADPPFGEESSSGTWTEDDPPFGGEAFACSKCASQSTFVDPCVAWATVGSACVRSCCKFTDVAGRGNPPFGGEALVVTSGGTDVVGRGNPPFGGEALVVTNGGDVGGTVVACVVSVVRVPAWEAALVDALCASIPCMSPKGGSPIVVPASLGVWP